MTKKEIESLVIRLYLDGVLPDWKIALEIYSYLKENYLKES